jgi:pimeloyl-ACP methyl ester carboxylesterase
MKSRSVDTPRGTHVRVFEAGAVLEQPLVFLHGVLGLLSDTTFLDALAERYHVFAPEMPGYGESTGEELLEDMLDFTLHGWDVLDALGLEQPMLVGHSLGGMIAAEMACLAPSRVKRLVLVDPFGLWLDEHPIPDLFSFLPFEFGDVLFHDEQRAAELLVGATDVAEPEALRQFFIDNARRLGTAGKLLFPIPNRRLSKRLYRLTAETLIVWGENDRLIPPEYAAHWQKLVPHARVECVRNAGHMLPYEQPQALAALI